MAELEFVHKSVPAVRLAQLGGSVAAQAEIGSTIGTLFDRLAGLLAAAGEPMDQPAVAWYFSDDSGRIRFAAGFPTSANELAGVPDVEVADLEAEPNVVTVIHRGGMETIGDTWQALGRYVGEHGLRFAGRCREVYLSTPMDAPDEWVTELQQPVA